jgi:glycosyltransferase involved in cell wall biosynthesis
MGNAQRNAALQLASEDFVYFLDDDNILHPDFISTIERCIIDYPHKKCFVFNQIDRDGNIRCQSNSDNVRPGYIDIAQYVIHKSIINKNDDGLVVFANDSDKKHRGADGKFIERIYHKNKNSFVFIDKTLCYYNYLQSEYKCGLLGNELIVGLMMTRNESDIIAEILDSWLKRGLKIIAMDDSDDGTFEILQKYPNVIAFKQSEIYPENCIGSGDWMYQGLLEKKRELFGIDNYVILTLGDEFWFFDPTKIVYEMAREGATLAKLESYQFYPHISDKYKFNEDYEWNDNKKFINRLSRHETGWLEDRIFFDNGKCNYAPKQAFRTIPIDLDIKLFSKTYYYGHYHLRSPKQILSRSKDRVTRGYQPFYEHSYNKSLDDTFYSKYPGSSIEKNSVFSTTITIITPCTRENNLKLIEKSIFDQKSKANFVDINWIIVVDNDIIAKLKDETLDANIIYYSDEDSISGNEQRNKGLEFVKDGWVYFLDDDNILHPDFIEIFENTLLSNPKKKGFVFDQIFTTGEIRCLAKEENVRTGYIDTAQFIIHRSIISELWKKNTYDADGYFISSIFNNNKDGFVFINKSFCYYNWLRPKIDIKQNEIERTENNTSPVNVVSNQAIPVRDVRLRRRR